MLRLKALMSLLRQTSTSAVWRELATKTLLVIIVLVHSYARVNTDIMGMVRFVQVCDVLTNVIAF